MKPEMPQDPLDESQTLPEIAPEVGTDDGYNKIELDDGVLADAEIGAPISATIEGTVEEDENGLRCLRVTSIDGQPLAAEEAPEAGNLEADLDQAIEGLNGKNKF